jgi:D-aspartate ligase
MSRSEKPVPVIVLGTSITGIGVLRSLGRVGLPVYTISQPRELLTKSRWFRTIPGADATAVTPDNLEAFLSGLSIEHAVLVQCSDDWSRAVTNLPPHLKERFPASACSAEIMDTMTDKWNFAEMLDRLNLPHPKTMVVRSLDEMAALPEACYESRFLKPLDSQDFSRRHNEKAFMISGKASALDKMRAVSKNGYSGFPVLLQEYIPGPPTNHYFIDGFVDRNRKICTLFARQRLRMFPPRFGNSTLMETVPLEEVAGAVDTIKRMWAALEYRGIFSCEFKLDDRDGQFKLIEVNARPWWFIEFATRCGINVCEMGYRDALGLPVEPLSKYPIGRRCVYLPNDFTAYRTGEIGGMLTWVRSWFGAEGTIFSWDDPGPSLTSMYRTSRRVLRRAITQ